MYNRILVPIDDSEVANSLIQEVVSMGTSSNDCVITLLHVLRPVEDMGVPAGYVVDAGNVDERLAQDGKQVLERARQRLQTFNIEANVAMEWGDPANEICRYAEKAQIDLIIVGNKDKNLLQRLLIGSVSQKVVQAAPSHVLVVK